MFHNSPEDRHLKIAGITVGYTLAIVLLIPAVATILTCACCFAAIVAGAINAPSLNPTMTP